MEEAVNEYENELKSMLEFFASVRKEPLPGYSYTGMDDFLLQHGTWFKLVPFPGDVDPGAPKSCFGNALVLAVLHGFRYIEGYAFPILEGNATVPIHHAWNVTKDGMLIDNTWMNRGLAYLGVEFSVGRVDNATWFDDACVLDNPRNRNALYKERWTGEDFNRVWRRSKPFKQLQRMRKDFGLCQSR